MQGIGFAGTSGLSLAPALTLDQKAFLIWLLINVSNIHSYASNAACQATL